MKYTPENVQKIVASYNLGAAPKEIALEYDVPERSIIAKLASLGVYKRKEYLTKQGEVPIKKAEYIENIAKLLNVDLETLDSLEKVDKNVLKMLQVALT